MGERGPAAPRPRWEGSEELVCDLAVRGRRGIQLQGGQRLPVTPTLPGARTPWDSCHPASPWHVLESEPRAPSPSSLQPCSPTR